MISWDENQDSGSWPKLGPECNKDVFSDIFTPKTTGER
jgi:hypothetical protein